MKEVLVEKSHPSVDSLGIIDEVSPLIEPDEERLRDWTKLYVNGFRHRFAFDLDYARDYFKAGAAVLEVGAVPLVLTGALAKHGFDVVGIDLDPDRFAQSSRKLGIEVKKCDVEKEKLPVEDGVFDGLVFNEIFEHLRVNPIFTVSELNRVLKEGGTLLLSTPNPHSFYGYVRFLFGRQTMFVGGTVFYEYGKLESLGHMGHVREYGTADVFQFFRTMGFTPERVIYRGPKDFRLLPDRFRRFATYVFKKTGEPLDPSKAEESAPEVMGVRNWGVRLIALPVVIGCYLIERVFYRCLGKRMGVPSEMV